MADSASHTQFVLASGGINRVGSIDSPRSTSPSMLSRGSRCLEIHHALIVLDDHALNTYKPVSDSPQPRPTCIQSVWSPHNGFTPSSPVDSEHLVTSTADTCFQLPPPTATSLQLFELSESAYWASARLAASSDCCFPMRDHDTIVPPAKRSSRCRPPPNRSRSTIHSWPIRWDDRVQSAAINTSWITVRLLARETTAGSCGPQPA